MFDEVAEVVERSFILPLRHRTTGIKVDIALGLSGFERSLIDRAEPVDIAGRLYAEVRDLPFVEIPPPLLETDRHAYYNIPFTYRPGVIPLSRDEFVEALKAEGVKGDVYVRVPLYLRPRFQDHDYFGRGYPWAIAEEPVVYRKGDCPVAERMAKVEFQVSGNYYEDAPELMAQIGAAMRKVGENAGELRAWFDARKAGQAAG